jgi:hypothetical protein
MQKLWLLAAVLLLVAPCAHAQFGWDEEPEQTAATDSFDAFDTALRTPVIEPIRPIRPVIEPAVPVFQPFIAPVVDADPLVEQCDIEPEVAQVYRASGIDDSTRDPQPATSYGRDAACPEFLGRLSANPYAADSTANPYSPAGSPYSAKSVNNPYGQFGSPFSPTSARNPYATDAPKIVAQDGTYLGELSDNPYDPDSVANPYGRYGSPYSSTSIKNPYSTYGSPYSSQSPNNPYATQAPLLFGD